MVITLCYDAISRNVEGLGISPFIMFSLSATAIFPACVVLLLLQDKIGRKAMASSSLLISGVFTVATGFLLEYNHSMHGKYLQYAVNFFEIEFEGHFLHRTNVGRYAGNYWTVRYNGGLQFWCPVCDRIDSDLCTGSRCGCRPCCRLRFDLFQYVHFVFGKSL